MAGVTHVSSSASPIYDWNVTFTVTDLESNTATTYGYDACCFTNGLHHSLGEQTDRTSAEAMGYACVQVIMDQGDYNIEAAANLLGEYDEGTDSVDSKVTDMITVNNDYDFTVSVTNFEPQILTIVPSARDILVGDTLTITATAFDVEGDELTFSFNDGTGAGLACEDVGDAMSGT